MRPICLTFSRFNRGSNNRRNDGDTDTDMMRGRSTAPSNKNDNKSNKNNSSAHSNLSLSDLATAGGARAMDRGSLSARDVGRGGLRASESSGQRC